MRELECTAGSRMVHREASSSSFQSDSSEQLQLFVRRWRPPRLHFPAHSFPHAFEDDIHGLDNSELWVCLAIHDQLVLGFPALPDIHVVPFRKPVVPAAVPRTQQVRLILPGSGELSTPQRPYV